MIGTDFTFLEPVPVEIPEELHHLNIQHPLVLEALVRRGIKSLTQAQAFLDPSHYHPADPRELPDLDLAASRLLDAINNQEPITIWGDFDVDGQTATAVLAQTLSSLGAKFDFYLPVRATESHGISVSKLECLIKNGTKVLLTCDTGITAFDAAGICRKYGVDMLITDHHSLPDSLPEVYAAVNPQRLPDIHPLHPLCGAGAAYQLALELLRRFNRDGEQEDLLDLVCLGTIADMAPLTGDNRYLVQRGLQKIRSASRRAIGSIMTLSGIDLTLVNEEHLAYILAPRLNALGRLSDANPVIAYLLSNDDDIVKPMTNELEGLNARRKLLCDQVFKAAIDRVNRDRTLQDDDVLVLEHASWPAGVIGIVASRLVEIYHRPVILISADPSGIGRASARSVEGINITDALAQNQQLLIAFGGHRMAAGFSIRSDEIAEFRRSINRVIHKMRLTSPPPPLLSVEAYLSLDQISLPLVEEIDRISPFGTGNPMIVLACKDLVVRSASVIGRSKEHLQVIVDDISGNSQKVLWWQGAGNLLPDDRFDLAFTVRASNYRGKRAVQLEWLAARKSQGLPEVKTPSDFTILDFRHDENPWSRLSELIGSPDLLIWLEGEPSGKVPGTDRFHLRPSKQLVLWNIPPGPNELTAILKTVKPKLVIVFGIDSGMDTPQAFMNRLAGLVKFQIKEHGGLSSIQAYMSATNQRETTVRKGLTWLSEKGFISIETINGFEITIRKGTGRINQAMCDQLEAEIGSLLAETAAFRQYFKNANLNQLMEV